MSTHLSPIETIREKELKDLCKEYARQSYLVSEENHPEEDEVRALENIIFHYRTALTSFIEAEIEKWKGERKEIAKGIDELGRIKSPTEIASLIEDKGHNSALSSVIEHLEEIKKLI